MALTSSCCIDFKLWFIAYVTTEIVGAIIDRPFGYTIRIRIGSQKNRDVSLRGRSMIAPTFINQTAR